MDAWRGFTAGDWQQNINVRDFVYLNYTPYDGDAGFLAPPTPKTLKIWDTLQTKYLPVERQQRVYDVETSGVADIDEFDAGYINEHDDVIVGLQTDTPLKRAMMPKGGWRMVETALNEAGIQVPENIKHVYTKHVKTHNEGVFDAYTPDVRLARSNHLISGLPDAYGRGRLVPEVTRVALYGLDRLILGKREDLVSLNEQEGHNLGLEDWIKTREEISEQIKALKKMGKLAQKYGFNIHPPARNAKEATQWTYFAYLAAIKSQDGAAMSIGRLSHFLDIYIQRDLNENTLTETQAQELIDNLVIKLRIVRFLRTKDYDNIFSGDPYWATWTDGGMWQDNTHQITRTSYRLLHTLTNLGPAPEPNITILWHKNLPENYKKFCAETSIKTSALQYENDEQIRKHWGDYAAIACCVSPITYGKGIQYFGARANLAKTLLYALNNGKDELTGKQVIPTNYFTTPNPVNKNTPLNYEQTLARFTETMNWLGKTYAKALNIVHYMHDKYSYEAAQHALIDTHPQRVMGMGIAGLSAVADSLSAIKHAKVTPILNENGIVTDFKTEGNYPYYGNDDDNVDMIAANIVKQFDNTLKQQKYYRNAQPTQSVLTITSNVVYGKHTGTLPARDVHQHGQPFSPGANPSNGKDTHGMLASMLSVSKLKYEHALDGISLTNTIVPASIGRTLPEQTRNLSGLLDASFGANLYHANINVLDRELLQDAILNPLKYPQLTIRVSGYAVNFTRLTREQQEDILSRTFHAAG